MNYICGIDPGKTGAISLITNSQHLILVEDMPPSVQELAEFFRLHADSIGFAVVEEVGSMIYTNKAGERRGQGAKPSFTFGKGFGEILGVLAALQIPVKLIKPSVWKSLMNLSSNKNDSLALARKLFPDNQNLFTRKKDADRAEASLLAWFGADRLL